VAAVMSKMVIMTDLKAVFAAKARTERYEASKLFFSSSKPACMKAAATYKET
jgi:hypothetical protein